MFLVFGGGWRLREYPQQPASRSSAVAASSVDLGLVTDSLLMTREARGIITIPIALLAFVIAIFVIYAFHQKFFICLLQFTYVIAAAAHRKKIICAHVLTNHQIVTSHRSTRLLPLQQQIKSSLITCKCYRLLALSTTTPPPPTILVTDTDDGETMRNEQQ